MAATATMVASPIHLSVLAPELIELIAPSPGETVIDCTFGSGGHALRVADLIGPTGTLIAIDRDSAAQARFEELAGELGCKARFVRGEFSRVVADLGRQGVVADAIYADFGVSSIQLDDPERGFAYSHDAGLDMRMDPDAPMSAREVVNEWPERRLSEVLRSYGEERHARAIAREVVARRPIETTAQLVDAIRAAVPAAVQFGRSHPARRSFQAIRIAVNAELEAIDALLPSGWNLLGEGGRFGAISFHSLEDRRVKRFFAGLCQGCICPPELPICTCAHQPEAELVNRKPVFPGEAEVGSNPRARSARLRVARKIRGVDVETKERF